MAFRSSVKEKFASSSCSKVKSRRLSFSPVKSRNSTIVLDSSSELEIIEPSYHESPCEFDWIRTPRSARVRSKNCHNFSTPSAELAEGTKRKQLVSNCSTSPGSQVIKRRKISHHSPAAVESPLAKALKSPEPKKNSIKPVTPPLGNFLVGSKRRNVEAWLTSTGQKNIPIQPVNNGSPFDPKVEEVLKSVYGNVWLKKALKKCATDVKKEHPANNRPLASESKQRVTSRECLDEVPKSSVKARRKIFDSPQIPKETEATPVTNKKRSIKKPRRNISILQSPPGEVTPMTVPSSCSKTPSQANPVMTPRRTFLSSLAPMTPTSVSHPEATDYKKNFKKKKDELAAKLFKMYNANVFDNRLPEDLSITWNPRMRGTAGFCYCKRRRDRKGVITRQARIVLSPKVIDRADRLRDTLIHELCHAAAWLIDGVVDNHGPLWTEWTRKARHRFPELPVIKRCHSYDIATKFVYKCAKCGYCIKRHTKSLDIERKRCGKCLGQFELFASKKQPGNNENQKLDITRTLRAPNAFALFVKENYKVVKETHPGMKHPEVMKVISEQYAVFKSVVTPNKK